ncbi:MAG TPA: ATP-dependent helicase DinG, partial [Paenibacillaceae bacterium]|nr:ATP-dependent helicase DinG [Paenibacillaceae bacterium]
MKGLNKYLVIDFETTGNKPKDGDRIIQVGAVLVENGMIVDRYATLVNPGVMISPFIENLTGITNSMVRTAPDIEEILPDLLRLTDDVVLVGHNIYFDLYFLQNAFIEGGYLPFAGLVLDTVEMARLLLPSQDGYRLTDLSSELDIPLDRPHRADEDA